MKVNSEIFRAYDIRGIVDKDLTEEITFFLGKAIGTFIQLQGRNSVITARDGRISGDRLQREFQKGVLSSGCNVLDVGKVPTPLLYFTTFVSDISDGVMLTGSHNPKNYNGLKIVLDRQSTTSEKISEIKSIIFDEKFIDGKGKLSFLDIKEQYLEKVKEKIKIKRSLKVCLDCGNGIGGVVAPEAFKLAGIELVELFSEVDGDFPNHHPDPSNPKNLEDLQSKVIETESDLGIALDGDGDRVGLIDNNGNIIYPDKYMMLLVEDILSKHKKGSITHKKETRRRQLSSACASSGTAPRAAPPGTARRASRPPRPRPARPRPAAAPQTPRAAPRPPAARTRGRRPAARNHPTECGAARPTKARRRASAPAGAPGCLMTARRTSRASSGGPRCAQRRRTPAPRRRWHP